MCAVVFVRGHFSSYMRGHFHMCAVVFKWTSGSYHFYDKVQSSACTPTSTQPKVIMINLTVGKSYETYFIPSPVLFHCPPSLISLSFHCCLASNFIAYQALFHSCLAFHFIAYPALFHCYFIPAWPLISLPTQPYFIAISFLPGF